jgi:hypothetical protein
MNDMIFTKLQKHKIKEGDLEQKVYKWVFSASVTKDEI